MANKISKKQIGFLLILSFLATLLVFRFVKKKVLNVSDEEVDPVPENVFYADHIAPLLINHCITCHRPDGVAPFALTDYDKVFRKKKTIKKVVERNIMPPWPADPTYSHFLGENVLNDVEKETLFRWIEQGARFGDSTKLPEIPHFSSVSNLGDPDVTIYLDSFLVEGNNRDKFLVIKTPFELPNDTFIRAIEFVPGKDQLVHHLNADLLNYDYDKKHNVLDGNRVVDVEIHPEEFENEFRALRVHHDDGSMPQRYHSAVNYLPGVIGTIYPEGVGGFKVNRKAAMIARDLHYAPVQKDHWDRSHYNIFFSKTPPSRLTKELMLGTNGVSPIQPQLVIPPDTIMTFKTQYRLTADISVLTVNPHMHLLGDSLIAYAITSNKDTIPIIRINRWDFRWQYFYTFPKMLKLEAGTTIVVEASFDNTSANKNNPFDPPQTVSERYDREGAGMRTTDEMFQFIITYLDYQDGDEDVSLDVERQGAVKPKNIGNVEPDK
ncbi:MAG: hypothetical protein JJ975_08120 [Bacteroidia bacterium]|nr:hypothetical protein [Bacteroidia bacterium]